MSSESEIDFIRLAGEPQYWVNKAIGLRSAAGAIWYCSEVAEASDISDGLGQETPLDFSTGSWQVYRMLCGMSLELLYKATIVAKGEAVPRTHNLLRLVDKAGDNVTRKEAGILELLTECIVWEGRYPVPRERPDIEKFVFLHYENLFYKERIGNSVILKPIEPDPMDWENYTKMWDKAYSLYVFVRS